MGIFGNKKEDLKPGVQPEVNDQELKGIEKEEAIAEQKVRGRYGMYTAEGNDAVRQIIENVRLKRSRYEMAQDGDKIAVVYLRTLSKQKGFEEAKDDFVKFLVFNETRKRK